MKNNMKRLAILIMMVFVSVNLITFSVVAESSVLASINGDSVSVGNFISPGTPNDGTTFEMPQIVSGAGIDSTNAYNLKIYSITPSSFTAPITTATNGNSAKKYYYRAYFKLSSDFPTDTLSNVLIYGSNGISPNITVPSGSVPPAEQYNRYAYFKYGTTDRFYPYGPTCFKLSNAQTAAATVNVSNITLNKTDWVPVEAVIYKPSGTAKISIGIYLDGNTYNGQNILMDNATIQELNSGEIAVKKDNAPLTNNILTVSGGAQTAFTANVYNQFNTELGFKDHFGRVMEPIKWTIKDENNSVVWTGGFDLDQAAVPSNIPIYISTARQEYTLTTNASQKWTYPTYNFTVCARNNALPGNYTVTGELQNGVSFGWNSSTSFTLNIGNVIQSNIIASQNADDMALGSFIANAYYPAQTVATGMGICGSNAFKMAFGTVQNSVYYTATLRASVNSVANKKYLYRAYYKLDSDFSTDTLSDVLVNLEGANSNITVPSGAIPSNSDFAYYSYFKYNSQDRFYTKGPTNFTLNNADTAAANGNKSTITLNKNTWTPVETAIYFPSTTTKFECGLYYPSNISGKNVLMDNATIEELKLSEISLNQGGGSISNDGLTIKAGNDIALSATVKNQFGSELGFKDHFGKVMEPLEWTIKDSNNNVVWRGSFDLANTPITAPAYVQTNRKAYTLTTNTNASWVVPTYDFVVKTNSNLSLGKYTLTAGLKNTDIIGSWNTVSIPLNVTNDSNTLYVSNTDYFNGATSLVNCTSVSGKVTINNSTNEAVNPIAFLAVYKDNYLYKVFLKEQQGGIAAQDSKVMQIDTANILPGGQNSGYTARLFVFKNLSSIIPICNILPISGN